MHNVDLGPFKLVAPIAEGGMGVVWHGVHRAQNVPVAIKVLTTFKALDTNFRDDFRSEVSAVATLNHPGIVMVFEYGEVTPEAEQQSEGKLVAGGPYLVMELMNGGTLSGATGPLPWEALRHILNSLLDALAHAHARGLVHRDIKPENVLLGRTGTNLPAIKLSDFGIAHVLNKHTRTRGVRETMGSVEGVSGTPHYMATEQVQGHWRDYGPWTDLYAVGCIAYELATGRTPFVGSTFMQLAFAHLNAEIPALTETREVPSGFEGWVRQLMEKDHHRRFQRAADAAFALAALEEHEAHTLGTTSLPIEMFGGDTTALMAGRQQTLNGSSIGDLNGRTTLTPILSTGQSEDDIPAFDETHQPDVTSVELMSSSESCRNSLPTTWRRPDPPEQPIELVGVGLGVYEHRQISMVGRELERDLIWGALSAAHRTGRARLVAVTGAPGVGKSRLIQWICQRAHEVGGATILKAEHSPNSSATDGLPAMLARHLRCIGLSRDDVRRRLEKILEAQGVLDAFEAPGLTTVILPVPEDNAASRFSDMNFERSPERFLFLRRHLERTCQERPIILWLEDAHWSSDTLAFCQYLLEVQEEHPCPVVMLLSASNDALMEPDYGGDLFDSLMGHANAERLELKPLTGEETTQLVQQLLCLEGKLAKRVESRCGGNPQYAVQLVNDLVRRGVLEVGSRGFILASGKQTRLPGDIQQLWKTRLSRLMAEIPEVRPRTQRALEIAAVLAREIDQSQWATICDEAGVTHGLEIIDTLVNNGLVQRRSGGGWRFLDRMLRETLGEFTISKGRWPEHNRFCALMLNEQSGSGGSGLAERVARHFLAAGADVDAVEPLLNAAKERADAGEYGKAKKLLAQRELALKNAAIPASDERWGEGWVLRASTLNLQTRYAESRAWAGQAISAAKSYGWTNLLPAALRQRAYAEREHGDLRQASKLLEESLRYYRDARDKEGVANCMSEAAVVARMRGNTKGAIDGAKRALSLFKALDDKVGMANCYRSLGAVMAKQTQLRQATAFYRRARSLYKEARHQYGMATCLNDLAEIARSAGDNTTAEIGYRKALKALEAVGSSDAFLPRLNLGIILMVNGRYEEARTQLEAVCKGLEERGQRGYLGGAIVTLLPCYAVARDWKNWDLYHGKAAALLEESGKADRDTAIFAQLAADIAYESGELLRAKSVFRLAIEQWHRLGDIAEIEAAEAAMSRMGIMPDS